MSRRFLLPNVDFGAQRAINATTPTTSTDLATKSYVDATGVTAKYTAAITATGANQSVATGTSTPIQLLNARRTSTLVTPGGTNNNVFTLAAGQWNFFAKVHLTITTGGEVFSQLVRNDTSEIFADWYVGTLAATKTYDINYSGSDYFSSSASVNLYIVTTSPAAGSVASGAAASGIRTYLAMQWMGP